MPTAYRPSPLLAFALLQLAQLVNEKPQVINEYESGKAIPNPQVRELGGRARSLFGRVGSRTATLQWVSAGACSWACGRLINWQLRRAC